MKRKAKRLLPLILSISVAASLTGCMTDAPSATFNPEAVYQIPPEGAWMPDLVDDATRRRTGKIFVPPGTILVYDGTEIE